MSDKMLSITDLKLAFKSYRGSAQVLHGISLDIARGETVALVGESGSGKSVTGRIILGLLQRLSSASISGQIVFDGRDLAQFSEAERYRLRGTAMSMIFQDPTSALNPVFRIGELFREVLRRRNPRISRAEAAAVAHAALEEVAITQPERVLNSYSFQLSGGMNQRMMIAMALVNEPKLLIADEPGTALDVTVQAQTLKLMADLVRRHGTSVLFISHNLGVVREVADRVYVIYKGRIVETGPTATLFETPGHPYTRALLSAVPRITGGGIPDLPEENGDFLAPVVVHA